MIDNPYPEHHPAYKYWQAGHDSVIVHVPEYKEMKEFAVWCGMLFEFKCVPDKWRRRLIGTYVLSSGWDRELTTDELLIEFKQQENKIVTKNSI